MTYRKNGIYQGGYMPVNRQAAHALSGPQPEQPNSYLKGCQRVFLAPPPMRDPGSGVENLIGRTFGRFTVAGLSVEKRRDGCALWVCRCVCGRYELRKSKAVRNSRNSGDACWECRRTQHLIDRASCIKS